MNNIEKFIKVPYTKKVGIHISLTWDHWQTPYVGFFIECKCVFLGIGPLIIDVFFDHKWD